MANHSKTSRFEWIVGRDKSLRPQYDIPVFETNSFVVMPSLGSLVAGWLLVIPRRRIPNLSHLNIHEREELRSLVSRVDGYLQHFPGTVFRFEHGGAYGSLTSCGVDQAHLHLVPLQFDLIDIAVRRPDIHWSVARDRNFLAPSCSDKEYFSAFSGDGRVAVGLPEAPQSQWFRRLIAKELSLEQWDYRAAPRMTTMQETLTAFAA